MLHVNATAFGGGVAEILGTLVPLMNDVGLDADWQVIKGADEFFNVTKAMHNSLQGMYYDWTPAMRETWLDYNKLNADLFDESYDYVVIHDPQPAAIPAFLEERTGARPGKWVWRCHIDLTDAQVQVWDLLRPHVERYDGAIFTLPDVREGRPAAPADLLRAAGDRSAEPEERRPADEDTVNAILRTLRRRPGAADGHADLALRPVEGPARRDRRLSRGEARDPGPAARDDRVDGAATTRRAGTGTSAPCAARARTSTSTSSATSTASATSRSTRFSARRASSSRSPCAKGSGS